MTIAIIGPGLIGRSAALALQRVQPDARVMTLDRGDAIASARGADLILLAAPVAAILQIIRDHADVLASSVTVDTGSTKRAIVRAARAAGLTTFVGGHPMAGGTSSDEARADLFDRRPWFLVPNGAAAAAIERVRAFVQSVGAVPIDCSDDGEEHDRVLAAVSHLPQVVSSTLMIVAAAAAGERLDWAGAGLRDTTRLAEGSAAMWQSILESNADQLAPLLREMSRRLEAVADQLSDPKAMADLFEQARRARALL